MPDSEGHLPHDKDSLNGRHHTSGETCCRCLARLSDGAVHTLTRLIVSWPRRGAGVFCSLLALFRQWGENDNEANVVIYQRSGWIWSHFYLSVNHILFHPTVTCTWRCPINHFFVRMIYLPSSRGICLFLQLLHSPSFILFTTSLCSRMAVKSDFAVYFYQCFHHSVSVRIQIFQSPAEHWQSEPADYIFTVSICFLILINLRSAIMLEGWQMF